MEGASINICFYTSDIYEAGGIGRVTGLIASGLSEAYNVSVLTLTARQRVEGRLPDSVAVEVQFDRRISLTQHFLSCVAKTRAYLVEHHMDVLVCTNEMLAPVCALAVAGTGTRYMAWLHSNIDITKEYKFQGLCRQVAVRTADRIVVLTPEMQEKYVERFHKKNVQVIANPIDQRLMTPVHYNAQSRRIISVGRLVYAKNYELLVDVAALVLNKHPDWSWDIYGDGRLKEQLREKIQGAGLSDRLHLMGSVDDIYDRYGDYAFLVMTSRYEGFPMVLLEGMAKGLPLVAFDITTGPKYMIHHGKNGFLVPEQSAGKMAADIETLMENEPLRIAMSRENAEKREAFSLSAVLDSWQDALERVSGPRT